MVGAGEPSRKGRGSLLHPVCAYPFYLCPHLIRCRLPSLQVAQLGDLYVARCGCRRYAGRAIRGLARRAVLAAQECSPRDPPLAGENACLQGCTGCGRCCGRTSAPLSRARPGDPVARLCTHARTQPRVLLAQHGGDMRTRVEGVARPRGPVEGEADGQQPRRVDVYGAHPPIHVCFLARLSRRAAAGARRRTSLPRRSAAPILAPVGRVDRQGACATREGRLKRQPHSDPSLLPPRAVWRAF